MNFFTASRIDYLNFRWNIHSGCDNFDKGFCQLGGYCWARNEVDKYPDRYPYGFEPHFWPEALTSVLSLKKPSRVGVGFQGDLFCSWTLPSSAIEFELKTDGKIVSLRSTARDAVFAICRALKDSRFLFLTKNWANIHQWEPFPSNAWVGCSTTNQKFFDSAVMSLPYVRCAHRWLSIEPVYERIEAKSEQLFNIGWVVIGAQTKPQRKVFPIYIEGLVKTCLGNSTPVFLKKNIWSSLPQREPFFHDGAFRQEYPSDLNLPEKKVEKK